MSTIKIINPRSVSKGTLDLAMPSGMTIFGVMLHGHSSSKSWVGLPSREWLSARQRTFSPLIGFTDKETRNRFQGQVLPLALEAFAEMVR
jgi:hypothetical protein